MQNSVGRFFRWRPSFSCAIKPHLPGMTFVSQVVTSYRNSPWLIRSSHKPNNKSFKNDIWHSSSGKVWTSFSIGSLSSFLNAYRGSTETEIKQQNNESTTQTSFLTHLTYQDVSTTKQKPHRSIINKIIKGTRPTFGFTGKYMQFAYFCIKVHAKWIFCRILSTNLRYSTRLYQL